MTSRSGDVIPLGGGSSRRDQGEDRGLGSQIGVRVSRDEKRLVGRWKRMPGDHDVSPNEREARRRRIENEAQKGVGRIRERLGLRQAISRQTDEVSDGACPQRREKGWLPGPKRGKEITHAASGTRVAIWVAASSERVAVILSFYPRFSEVPASTKPVSALAAPGRARRLVVRPSRGGQLLSWRRRSSSSSSSRRRRAWPRRRRLTAPRSRRAG